MPLKGSYLLCASLSSPTRIRVGALGEISFQPGIYLYCGSAMGGVHDRVGRHFRKEKKIRWHIDYLLSSSDPFGALIFTEQNVTECLLRRKLSETGLLNVPAMRFGSSDCDCPSHLFHLEDEELLTPLLSSLKWKVTD